ncbi:MAG TPA: hypothetical protein DDX39_08290 [Bacteroidales bacterium]|nr:MAG: hypothetical protein A2W98_09760 [Bacteroidetes bacterium GWF2_33_38]OFY90257.1 MAG: hypothetical protein A2236_04670 [Bacteroidetes bacterium RIFOXYA2_FULL_33_7]HBF88625.1 hypothetical protein [Bacteroidales bacterium]
MDKKTTNKNIIYSFLILFLFFTFLQSANAQNKTKIKADEKFYKKEYYTAYNLYKRSLKKTESKNDKFEIYMLMGDCYKYMRNPKEAIKHYKKALKGNNNLADIIYSYAQMLIMEMKYDLAIEQFNTLLTINPGDKKAIEGIETCKLVQDWVNNPTQYVIDNMKPLNSKMDDYCPTLNARKDYNEIIFTSTRQEATGKKINGISGVENADLFEASMDRKGIWGEPTKFDTLVNTYDDDGAGILNDKANELYFTCCKNVKNKQVGCQIFKSAKKGGYWDKAEIIPIVGDSISIGQPSLTEDENTLYFSSRELGGIGGADIWKVTKTDGGWGVPENMGSQINSEYDELFPFIRNDGVLFFSSDRQPSIGGLDIFKAYKDKNDSMIVENMKYPINSHADDFGIVFKGTKEDGLFSSGRKGSVGGIDIYSFVIPPLQFTLSGLAKDEDNGQFLAGVAIKLIGSDGRAYKDTTNIEEGKYSFELKPNTEYIYIASLEGYFNYKGKISTDSLERSQIIATDIVMSSVAKTIELPNIEYDFGSAKLRDSSKIALDILVETLNDNPTITIELLSHSDMVGPDSTNMKLSQQRAQSVVDYLISKNIDQNRLSPKGCGESTPKVINDEFAKKYPFLTAGTILNPEFIEKLLDEKQKEICNQLNRRTEFKVLSTSYTPKNIKLTN